MVYGTQHAQNLKTSMAQMDRTSSGLRPICSLQDAILDIFRGRLIETYGANLGGIVLIGERARSMPPADAPFSIAVFLHTISNKRVELEKLESLGAEMLEIYGFDFRFFLFRTDEYQRDVGFIKTIRDTGHVIMAVRDAQPAQLGINPKIEAILTARDVFCLDFIAHDLGPYSYPIELHITNVKTYASNSWLIRPTMDWLTTGMEPPHILLENNMTIGELMNSSLPHGEILEDLHTNTSRGKILSDDPRTDKKWIEMLTKLTGVRSPHFQFDDFHDMAWQLASATDSASPQSLYQRVELAAFDRFHASNGPAWQTRRNTEILRKLAGYQDQPWLIVQPPHPVSSANAYEDQNDSKDEDDNGHQDDDDDDDDVSGGIDDYFS